MTHLFVVSPLAVSLPNLDPHPPLPERPSVPPPRQEHLRLPRSTFDTDQRRTVDLGFSLWKLGRSGGGGEEVRVRDGVDVAVGEREGVEVEGGAERDAGSFAGVWSLREV